MRKSAATRVARQELKGALTRSRAGAAPAIAAALAVSVGSAAWAQSTPEAIPETTPEPAPYSNGGPLSPVPPSPDEPADRDALEEAAGAEEQLTPEEKIARAFENLASEDEDTWRGAQQKIADSWAKSGSPSFDLLLQRSRRAMSEERWDVALDHLNDLVNLAPTFAEGWNLRATVHYHQDAYGPSLADIAETLALEPRHFGALTGLGLIMESLDQPDEALAAFRAALAVHPNLENAQEAVDRLAPLVDGRDS